MLSEIQITDTHRQILYQKIDKMERWYLPTRQSLMIPAFVLMVIATILMDIILITIGGIYLTAYLIYLAVCELYLMHYHTALEKLRSGSFQETSP